MGTSSFKIRIQIWKNGSRFLFFIFFNLPSSFKLLVKETSLILEKEYPRHFPILFCKLTFKHMIAKNLLVLSFHYS